MTRSDYTPASAYAQRLEPESPYRGLREFLSDPRVSRATKMSYLSRNYRIFIALAAANLEERVGAEPRRSLAGGGSASDPSYAR